MKRKTAALYNPYLDTLGGGEKHILSILKVLESRGYQISIFWDHDLRKETANRLNVSFQNITFLPNIFSKKHSIIEKLKALKSFDLFFYIPDGSYFFSSARRNYIFAMVPTKTILPHRLLDFIKIWNYKWIANSPFTKKWFSEQHIQTDVITPCIEDDFVSTDILTIEKEPIILSVGRFFKHLHGKKQHIAIDAFRNIKKNNPLLHNFKLILAGGLKNEDQAYFAELQSYTKQDPSICFKPNISFQELLSLYRKATFYWHFTGYGVDEKNHPEQVEHMGITPLEAMAMGCLTFCYRAGGPTYFIKEGINGFLFSSIEELSTKTITIMNSEHNRIITQNAHMYVKEHFGYNAFKNTVRDTLHI